MARQECEAWIALVDSYGLAAAELGRASDEAMRNPCPASFQTAEAARLRSQAAWELLERHIQEHRCQGLFPKEEAPPAAEHVLEKAAAAASDIILVADDARRFVEVNDAAVQILGIPREQIIGSRIEDFFAEARGQTITDAWQDFVEEGIQSGTCELARGRTPRRFDYRAKTNFVPGLHVSVLREVRNGSGR